LERKISSLQIQRFSKDTNTNVFESSAKSDINIKEPFEYIINEILKIKKKKINEINLDVNNSFYKNCSC
jgi:hypothetical protein